MATEYCTPSVRIYDGSWSNKGTATDWYGYTGFGTTSRGLEISFTPTKATTSQFHILVPQCVSASAGNNTWYYRVTDSQKTTKPQSVTGNIASGSTTVYSNVNSYKRAQFQFSVSGITAGKKYYVYLYSSALSSGVGYVGNSSTSGLIECRNYYTEVTYVPVTCKDRKYNSSGTLQSTTTVGTINYEVSVEAFGSDWGTTSPYTGYYYDSCTSTVIYTSTTSATVYRNFYPNSYTVKYNLNGASGTAPSSTTRYYNETYKLTSTTPSRSGYTFKGWNTSSSATSGSASGSTMSASTSTSTITYYAIWSQNSYTATVSYNANGGSGAPSSQTATETDSNVSITLSSTKPTRSGYNFLGWSTSSTATTASYSAGGTYNFTGTTSGKTTTLYAVWQQITYSITIVYNANGGSGAPSSHSNSNTSTTVSITLSSTKPTRSGYNFLGWSTSSTATTASYASGSSQSFTGSTTGTTINLYAVWQATYTVTIVYNANGGLGAPSSQSNTVTTTSVPFTLSSTQPTKEKYNFLGWSTSNTATVAEYQPNENVSFTGTIAGTTINLYAVWKINTIPIQIHNGTNYIEYAVYIHNGTAYKKAIPHVHNGTTYKKLTSQ